MKGMSGAAHPAPPPPPPPSPSATRTPAKSRPSLVRVPVLSKAATLILPQMAIRFGSTQKTPLAARRRAATLCPATRATGSSGLRICERVREMVREMVGGGEAAVACV
eukprot:scaffold31078_cov64-Phaeocystis_antarctica.AAC.2